MQSPNAIATMHMGNSLKGLQRVKCDICYSLDTSHLTSEKAIFDSRQIRQPTSSRSPLPFLPRPLSQDLSWLLLLPLAAMPCSAELPGISSCKQSV